MRSAQERLAAGDPAAAEALCREVLAQDADHPEALEILSRCEFERGRSGEGLRLALRAARSMQTHARDPAGQFSIWSNLNFMFTQALPGLDSTFARRKRAEYFNRPRSSGIGYERDPLVTVVIIDPYDAQGSSAALGSVSRQTYRNVELVIVGDADDACRDPLFACALQDCPFPIRWVASPGTNDAMRADAGVRAAAGQFVNLLSAGHQFSSGRLDTMLRTLAGQESGWGFSNVAFVDADGRPLAPERASRVRNWCERLAAIPEMDTVGYAFIHQEFVAVDAGNLIFRRSLYDECGGFRPLPHLWAWDFCLRALPLDEPVYVRSAEYVHCVADPVAAAEPRSAGLEAAQIAMFAEFYSGACRNDLVPPNPYAPCVAHWRMHFLKTVFYSGHVLAFPLEELERLGAAVLARSATRKSAVLEPGMDLVGFAFGEFGLGENLRAFARACERGGIPFGVKDVDMRLKTRQDDQSVAPHVIDELRHRCAVFCLNPDAIKQIRSLLVQSAAAGRYNIGYWFWELEQVPRQWDSAIADVDEIWVATQFIADAMRLATSKPIVKIPTPIEVVVSRPYTRAEFGLPDDRFLFLFSFDFNSFSARKNPEAAIAAFKQAFGPARRDAGLVIKSVNGAKKPEIMRAMRKLIGDDGRIVIRDGFFSRDEISGMQSVADAYVSLHRAEGLGLGLAESMYEGKPVIGTAYSGNLEFMDGENSCLVDYRLVPIAKGEYLYDDERFQWAEPDIEQAAQYMRRLVDDAEFRARIAARGQHDIRTRFTHANAALLMRQRLRELGLL